MSRYIDADELEELCDIMAYKCDGNGESIWNQFRTTVECCQTVDVVPVVRCKDCRHKYPYNNVWLCRFGLITPSDDGYCSYGKKVTE